MALTWDLWCRVVDNYGDAGVCWRLAADLAARGETVRLWIDDAAPLAWMAPDGTAGVEVLAWSADVSSDASSEVSSVEPGDVVVEAFACDPPPAFVARMQRARPPLWINLEYLSAEPYVARSHGLPSTVSHGPGAGLRKWFYFPGFTVDTGGLLREPGLPMPAPATGDEPLPSALAATGVVRRGGERWVSLYIYDNPALAALLDALAHQPTLLLTAPGPATDQVRALFASPEAQALAKGQGQAPHPSLRWHPLPWLTQPDYDALLRACDLNFVRGEDSFVRAQWAGRPFVWQAYPQDGGVHADKVDAFLARHLADATPPLAQGLTAVWQVWNGVAPPPAAPLVLPETDANGPWAQHARHWRQALASQSDLVTRLLAFVHARLGG